MEKSLLELFLPEGLLAIFDVEHMCSFCKIDTKEEGYIIHLDEKNILPEGFDPKDWESKGFMKPVLIQDFPIRGKLIFLSLRKRRWRHKVNKKEIVKRSHDFIGKGIQMTAELADFLKGTNREPRRYDVEYL